jgi:nickel transport protein
MNVFAWVEGKTVYGEASFSSNRKAIKIPVSIRDAANNLELLSLQTNNQGKFNFQITENMQKTRPDLLLIVNTGEGHRGEWLLSAKEYLPEGKNLRSIPVVPRLASKQSAPRPVLHDQDELLKQLIEQELEKKLAPIRRELAALKNPAPQLRDILGGLGCILGIAGIISWLHSRKITEKQ